MFRFAFIFCILILFMTGLLSCSTQKDICLKNGNYDHNTGIYKSIFKSGNKTDTCKVTHSENMSAFADTSSGIITGERVLKGEEANTETLKSENKSESKLSIRETFKMARAINKYKGNPARPNELEQNDESGNLSGLVSLVFGVIAFIFGGLAVYFLSINFGNDYPYFVLLLGFLFAVVAIIKGAVGLKDAVKKHNTLNKGLSLAGLIVGGVYCILALVLLLLIVVYIWLLGLTISWR